MKTNKKIRGNYLIELVEYTNTIIVKNKETKQIIKTSDFTDYIKAYLVFKQL